MSTDEEMLAVSKALTEAQQLALVAAHVKSKHEWFLAEGSSKTAMWRKLAIRGLCLKPVLERGLGMRTRLTSTGHLVATLLASGADPSLAPKQQQRVTEIVERNDQIAQRIRAAKPLED